MVRNVTPHLALSEIATCPRPSDQYLPLRERGVHRRGEDWVVARPADVAAALASPALGVAPAGEPAGDAARLQARMARFSDGVDHPRRRSAVTALLPALDRVDDLEEAAAQRTRAAVSADTVDAMPLARTVPVAVLATALGVAPADTARVAVATGRYCDAVAPPAEPDVDDAARSLTALLEPLAPGDNEHLVAAVSVLFQARDATAALVGCALLLGAAGFGDGPGTAGQWVERALRHDPPVQCTRRVALDDVELGGVVVPRGATVWVLLASAEVGPPDPPATFGSGPHACPGPPLATALARGVVSGLLAGGMRPVPGQPVNYESRANLRLPVRVLMEPA